MCLEKNKMKKAKINYKTCFRVHCKPRKNEITCKKSIEDDTIQNCVKNISLTMPV